jgi:hypothetical protein
MAMTSDERPLQPEDEEFLQFLNEAMSDPAGSAPRDVEAKYAEMIRAHFRTSRGFSWRSVVGLALCSSLVLTLLLGGDPSMPSLLATTTWGLGYGAVLKALVRFDSRRYEPA